MNLGPNFLAFSINFIKLRKWSSFSKNNFGLSKCPITLCHFKLGNIWIQNAKNTSIFHPGCNFFVKSRLYIFFNYSPLIFFLLATSKSVMNFSTPESHRYLSSAMYIRHSKISYSANGPRSLKTVFKMSIEAVAHVPKSLRMSTLRMVIVGGFSILICSEAKYCQSYFKYL